MSGILVTIDAGEFRGIGWAHENPFIAGETAGSIRAVIDGVIAPFIVGKDARDIATLMEGIERRLVFNYRAKAAIDLALHDVAARAAAVPLHRLLGGAWRDSVACIRMIGLDSPEAMAEEVRVLRAQGFEHFKLKIDAAPQDERRIRAVAELLGPGGKLVIDANQAYPPKGIVRLMDRLHDCAAIAIVEQPVPNHDIEGLALVRRAVRAEVEADEAVRTPGDAMRIIERGAADMISLKVSKMGGLYWTRKIADLCQAAGVPNRVGGHVGSAVVDIGHTHLACSHPNITAFGHEIGESRRLTDDVVDGLLLRDGRAYVSSEPGLGARLLPFSGDA